jgi:hypothetical protein
MNLYAGRSVLISQYNCEDMEAVHYREDWSTQKPKEPTALGLSRYERLEYI